MTYCVRIGGRYFYRAMQYCDSLIMLYRVTTKNLYLTMAKQQPNIINSMIESAKKEYRSTLLLNSSSCPKKFWRHINQLLKCSSTGNYHVKLTDPV